MAFATKVTIGTGNKVTQSDQSQNVSVSVTYELERSDTDLIAFMAEKAAEVEACHTAVWQGIYGIRAERANATGDSAASHPPSSAGSPDSQNQGKRARKAKELEAPTSNAPQPEAETSMHSAVPSAPERGAERTPSDTVGQEAALAPVRLAHPPSAPAPDVQVYEPATNLQKIVLRSLWTRAGHTPPEMNQLVRNLYGKATLDDLTKPEAAELTLALQKGEHGQPQSAAA